MTAKPAFADRPARRPSYVIEDQSGLTDIVVEAMSGAESIRLSRWRPHSSGTCMPSRARCS